MSKSRTFVALLVALLTLGLTGPASAKSLYVVASLSTNSPIRAYDINPTTGLITFQVSYTVSGYSGGAVDMAIDSDNGILFVVYEFSNVINMVNAKTMKSVGTTTMPVSSARSAGIVYDHARKRLYAAYRSSGRIYSYSWNAVTKKLTSLGNFSLGGASKTYGIDLDEGKGRLYVGSNNNIVRHYNVNSNFSPTGSFSVSPPGGTHKAVGVAVDAKRRFIYSGAGAESSGDSFLCKNNLDTGAHIGCVQGSIIRGLTVDSDSGFLYVTTHSKKNVQVYDSNLNLKQTTSAIGSPTGLVVPGKDIAYNPLNLTKSDGLNDAKDCVAVGANFTYTMSYTNNNSYQVTNTMITDSLPAQLSFVSATKGGSVNPSGLVSWPLGNLPPGNTGKVAVVVKVKSGTTLGSVIKNSATIKSDQTPPSSQGDFTNVCKAQCGNGKVESGELCDTKIPAGNPGACPTKCDDKNVCTKDLITGSACTAKCTHTPITAPANGDGCCPPGANSNNDSDCPVICGNGVIESGETCDPGIPSGKGKCPTLADCDDKDKCTKDSLTGGACTLKCLNTTLPANAAAKDGCCPKGASSVTDKDCPQVCGNGVLESGEQCDTGIKSGPGKCPTLADCDDKDKCTVDTFTGAGCSSKCTHTTLQPNPNKKDGCCPKGHTLKTDADCLPPCGPDTTKNCVNFCKDVKCPTGFHCEKGKCVPGDTQKDGGVIPGTDQKVSPPKKTEAGVTIPSGGDPSSSADAGGNHAEDPFVSVDGCACQTGGQSGSLPALLLVGLLLVLARRRRKEEGGRT